MNSKYLCVLITICIIIPICCIISGCSDKKEHQILIKHESRYAKLIKQKKELTENIINLSDGVKINYDFQVGPKDIQSPNFNVINIDMP